MISLLNISAVVAVTPLMNLIFLHPAILSHLASNSIIILILLVSLYSVFTAQSHRTEIASFIALVVSPFLSILYKVLTLASPAVIRTLLSNFTFAAIPLCVVSYVSELFFNFICCVMFLAFTAIVSCIYFAIELRKWEQEPLETRPTSKQVAESLKQRFENWKTENEEVIGALYRLGLDMSSALGISMIQYAVLGYYSVMLPPLVSADSTARIGPYDVLTYALVIALGIHATTAKVWQIVPSEVRSRVHDTSDLVPLKFAAIWFAELLVTLIATGLIVLRYVEIHLLRESAWMFWPFLKGLLLRGGYQSVRSISLFGKLPEVGKMALYGLFSRLSVSYGLSLWSGFGDASTRFDKLAAMM